MPITGADILIKLSTKAGAAGNSTASTPAGSLGKYISTTQLVNATLHNLFDAVSGDENVAGDDEYRCIFLHNNHATLTFQNVIAYLFSETPSGAAISIGVDPTVASAIGSAGAQAVEVTDEDTVPAGVVFTAPTTVGGAISIGSLAPGQCRAIWVKRLAANTAALANDNVVLRIQGESL